jgi:hypothetical protein
VFRFQQKQALKIAHTVLHSITIIFWTFALTLIIMWEYGFGKTGLMHKSVTPQITACVRLRPATAGRACSCVACICCRWDPTFPTSNVCYKFFPLPKSFSS